MSRALTSSTELREVMLSHGGVLDAARSRIEHFGNAGGELHEALHGCALVDRSALDRLLGTGPDLLGLLHRLSTADLRGLSPGQGSPTVLTTPKGRIVDLLFVHHLGPRGLLLVAGARCAGLVRSHLDRYTFRERTGLMDVSERWAQFALVGPRALRVLQNLGIDPAERFAARPARVGSTPADLLVQDGLTGDGFTFLVEIEQAPALWGELVEAVERHGGRPAGALAAEARRVLLGLPTGRHELGPAYNPLEAGLGEAVCFEKGCYVGQEVVARLRTYDKVARRLVGFLIEPAAVLPVAGTHVASEGRRIGEMTSVVRPPGWTSAAGLGYVKIRRVPEHRRVELRAADAHWDARVVEVPFPSLRSAGGAAARPVS